MPRTAPSDPASVARAETRAATGSPRADFAPSAGVGVIMGFLAATEGAGPGYGAVVGAAGCAAVLGMLAVKRALWRPGRSATTETAETTAAAPAGRDGSRISGPVTRPVRPHPPRSAAADRDCRGIR